MVSGTNGDTIAGWMTRRKKPEAQDVIDNSLSRQLVAREYREHVNDGKGVDRSRIVEAFSEGDQDMVTWCKRNCGVDGVDVFRESTDLPGSPLVGRSGIVRTCIILIVKTLDHDCWRSEQRLCMAQNVLIGGGDSAAVAIHHDHEIC